MNYIMNTEDNDQVTKTLDDLLIDPEILLVVYDLIETLVILKNDIKDNEVIKITYNEKMYCMVLMEISNYHNYDIDSLARIQNKGKILSLINDFPLGNINYLDIVRNAIIDENMHYQIDLLPKIKQIYEMIKENPKRQQISLDIRDYLNLVWCI